MNKARIFVMLMLPGAFSAIAWGAMVAIRFLYHQPVLLLAPSLPGFGFLAWTYGSLDLAADAQAALGLVVIPIYALLPVALGGVIGEVIDRRLRHSHVG